MDSCGLTWTSSSENWTVPQTRTGSVVQEPDEVAQPLVQVFQKVLRWTQLAWRRLHVPPEEVWAPRPEPRPADGNGGSSAGCLKCIKFIVPLSYFYLFFL